MQPDKMQILNLEACSYPKEFYATHVVEKRKGELVSSQTWRLVQWIRGDNSNPDALNGIFKEKLEEILKTSYCTDNPDDINQLNGRLAHLIENAKAFEEYKNSKTRTRTTTIMPPLTDLIQKAENRKQQLEAALAAARKQKLQQLDQSLALAWSYLFNKFPNDLDYTFRAEGQKDRAAALSDKFTEPDQEEALSVEFAKEEGPHTIARAMQNSVATLDPPLVVDQYIFFKTAIKEPDKEKRITLLKNAIKNLPPENQVILQMVVDNLRELAKSSISPELNKYLANSWGPILFKIPKETAEGDMLAEKFIVNALTVFLIQNDLFGEQA